MNVIKNVINNWTMAIQCSAFDWLIGVGLSERLITHFDTAKSRFHAVHRIGKPKENKHRPIIARFVCGEDREQVIARKKGIKESTRFKDAYITADYAKALQDERRKLIKAMSRQGSKVQRPKWLVDICSLEN